MGSIPVRLCDNAFKLCTKLKSVVIPNSVTSIGSNAFRCCESLKALVIPKNVTSIGELAFRWCKRLASITVEDENPAYKSIDGDLYTKDGTTLIRYATAKKATSFVVPNGVTTIGVSAFEDSQKLKSIILPKGLTTIDYSA